MTVFVCYENLTVICVCVTDLCKQDRLSTCWCSNAWANEERRSLEQLCSAG